MVHWAAIRRAAMRRRVKGEPAVDAIARYLRTEPGRKAWQDFVAAPPPGPPDLGPKAPGEFTSLPGGVWAYVPRPLPPHGLTLPRRISALLEEAEAAIAGLSCLAGELAAANPYLLWPLRRRVAVFAAGAPRLTRRALLIEGCGECTPNVDGRARVEAFQAVHHWTAGRLLVDRLGMSLVCELHRRLMAHEGAVGGAYRTTQSFIADSEGGLQQARYVAPPASEVPAAAEALDRFMSHEDELPLLVKLALIHYQIAAVHPFGDGNGRIARLLGLLLMRERGGLAEPVLSLDATLLAVRREYSDLLLEVSLRGAWQRWIEFVLNAALAEARAGAERARRLLDLWKNYRSAHWDAAATAVAGYAFAHPLLCVPDVETALALSPTEARAALDCLTAAGILAPAATRAGAPQCWLAHEIASVVQTDSYN